MPYTGFGQIGEALRRSTVQVKSGRRSAGSGIIWDSNGVIVTNSHVARSQELRVELWDGQEFTARVVTRDVRRDLAKLEAPASRLESVRCGDSSQLRPGELVVAVGNPLGFIGALSTGVVHAIGPLRDLGSQTWVQTDVRLAPGNSGGPLADANGHVIGVNAMVISGGLGLAVPSNAVADFLAHGSGAWLGVTVRPVFLPDRRAAGLLVLEVAEGSPAEAASLRTGDVLIGAGGQLFRSLDDLSLAIDRAGRGVLPLEFLRGDRSRTRAVAVRLGLQAAA
jgi:serine protease Do